jgi:hypothetical protein
MMTKLPDDAVLRAADRVLARASYLQATMPAKRALVVAMLEISPDSLVVCDELEDRERKLAEGQSAPDYEARESSATANMRALCAGLMATRIHRRKDWDELDQNGFGFEVHRGRQRVPVIMPSRPHADWDFERCYIDGNSWMWEYAPGIMRDALGVKR